MGHTRIGRVLGTAAVLMAGLAAALPPARGVPAGVGRPHPMTPFRPPGPGIALAPLVQLPVHTFVIVAGDSSAKFFVPDNRGGFSGHTTRVSGRIDVEPSHDGTAYTASIDASIDARSLTTDNWIRDRSMYGTFLQTDRYPAITFAGTATACPGLAVHPFAAAIRGRLTIRNVTRDTGFNATVLALADRYVADATATVRMADYGIPYPRAFIFVARDPVTVTLHLVAVSRKP